MYGKEIVKKRSVSHSFQDDFDSFNLSSDLQVRIGCEASPAGQVLSQNPVGLTLQLVKCLAELIGHTFATELKTRSC